MNDQREPQASSSNGVHKLDRRQLKLKEGPSLRGRRPRPGFSDSFSNIDLEALEIEEGGLPESSPRSQDQESETSSRASTSDSENNTHQWRGFFKILKKGSQMPFQTFHPLKNVPKLTRRKSKRIREDLIPSLNSPALQSSFDSDLYCFKSSWKNFTLAEIQAATNDFSHDNLIGEGGYAEVYLGKLEDGNFVAIKRLTRGSQEEMTADFLSELGIIVHVDHPNIARLIGYGVEGGMFLVLQLSPHGSLSSILYGPREKLNWGIRYKIAMGTAEGLRYLHEECQRRIIHKDIKASNILLSEDFEPQISDFGLAKWLPDQWTHHTVSQVEGTFGYLPPEFFMHGIVDEKTDVYAYGVLLLELITGRQALDSSQKSLVMWAKPLLSSNNTKELVDPVMVDAYDEEQMKLVIITASLCIDQSSMLRPHMSQVLQILRGEEDGLKMIKERQKSKLQRTYSEELYDAEEYNSTKILSERDRHMETILGSSNSIKEEESNKIITLTSIERERHMETILGCSSINSVNEESNESTLSERERHMETILGSSSINSTKEEINESTLSEREKHMETILGSSSINSVNEESNETTLSEREGNMEPILGSSSSDTIKEEGDTK